MECKHSAGAGKESSFYDLVCRIEWPQITYKPRAYLDKLQPEFWNSRILPQWHYIKLPGPSGSISAHRSSRDSSSRFVYVVAFHRLWIELFRATFSTRQFRLRCAQQSPRG